METKEKIKKVLSDLFYKGGRIIVMCLIFITGYFCSEIYHRITNPNKGISENSDPKITKKISQVSVAINERNELMIIDRSNGNYEIYQDSIGRCIFNLYANSIQLKYNNQ
jgi:hypothetical protein